MKIVLINCSKKFNSNEFKSFESKINNEFNFGLPKMITF